MSLGLCNSLGRLGLEEHDELQAGMTRISERAQTQAQAQAQAQAQRTALFAGHRMGSENNHGQRTLF
jgi:hypothetical protein